MPWRSSASTTSAASPRLAARWTTTIFIAGAARGSLRAQQLADRPPHALGRRSGRHDHVEVAGAVEYVELDIVALRARLRGEAFVGRGRDDGIARADQQAHRHADR